jgi:hypothetical protein
MNDDWAAMAGREVPGRHGTWTETDAGDPDRRTDTMTARVAAGEGV